MSVNKLDIDKCRFTNPSSHEAQTKNQNQCHGNDLKFSWGETGFPASFQVIQQEVEMVQKKSFSIFGDKRTAWQSTEWPFVWKCSFCFNRVNGKTKHHLAHSHCVCQWTLLQMSQVQSECHAKCLWFEINADVATSSQLNCATKSDNLHQKPILIPAQFFG